MASVEESVSANKREGESQREFQEEAGKSKKSIALYKFCDFMARKKIADEQIFSNLAALMKSLLCIPHSNASGERTFSMVRKIVTESRTSLHNDTVSALLSYKLNCDRIAAGFKLSKAQLKAAKLATQSSPQELKSGPQVL